MTQGPHAAQSQCYPILVNYLNLLEQLVNLVKAQPILAARVKKGGNLKLVSMIFVQELRYLHGKWHPTKELRSSKQ